MQQAAAVVAVQIKNQFQRNPRHVTSPLRPPRSLGENLDTLDRNLLAELTTFGDWLVTYRLGLVMNTWQLATAASVRR